MTGKPANQLPRVPVVSEVPFDGSFHLIEVKPGVWKTFVHCDVFGWSPSVLKRMYQIWPEIRASLPDDIYTQGNVDDDKFERFISRFGFSFFADCMCTDGVNRRIFVNRKENGR